MKKNHQSKYYSQCVILFCLAPNENAEIPLNFKDSLTGIKKKWSESQNDPTCSRIQIIYLSPTDTPDMEKFAPLRNIDRQSRIYIYGHARPGESGFRSDKHVYVNENAIRQKDKFQIVRFPYEFIAEILLQNITNPEVRLNRRDANSHYLLQAHLRRLKIGTIACSTNLTAKDLKGHTIRNSLGDDLFNYLLNHDGRHALLCDFVTSNASIFPRPYKVDNHKKEFLKVLFNHYRTPHNVDDIDFHKRYTRRPYLEGNWEFNPFKLFPRYQPSDHYKMMYVVPPTNGNNLMNKSLPYVKLNVPQAEDHFELQHTGERALALLEASLSGKHSEDCSKAANELRLAILNPAISKQELAELVMDLEQRMQSFAKPQRHYR